MFCAEASIRVFGEHSVYRRSTHTQRGRDRPRRFTARVHPLRQRSLLLIKRLWAADVLAPCPTRSTRRSAAFATKFRLQFDKLANTPRPPCGIEL